VAAWGGHQLRNATKKAAGSTRNGRDSLPKHLGAKLSDGEFAKVGAMIYKQRGTKILPGFGVVSGRDGSLHAELPGVVRYHTDRRRGRQFARIDVSGDVLAAVTKSSPADPKPLFSATAVSGFKGAAGVAGAGGP